MSNQMTDKKQMLTFVLFGNVYQHEKSAAVGQVLSCLRQKGAQVYIEKEYALFLSHSGLIEPNDGSWHVADTMWSDVNKPAVDFAISIGGDGTLLKTASKVGRLQIPILGVNMGRLGFLADVSANDFPVTLEALYSGDYTVEERALIRTESDGTPIEGCDCALNDVAILKRDTASMITIRASINGEFLSTYQADGLIVSSPTGSTAYSLSNGGPIIVPGTGVMLLTAVAPHSLNVRPIVIPDTAIVELTVSSRSHSFLVAIDGRSMKMPEGTTLKLSRAPYKVSVVKRPGVRYFTTLREKMMWGADSRG